MITEGCDQLRDVVTRVTHVSEATVTQYVGDIKMIDIDRQPGEPGEPGEP